MPAIHETLIEVASALADAGVGFVLGGSGMLYARGIMSADEVGDWDLAVVPDALSAVRAATAPWLRDVRRDPTELWASDWWATVEVAGAKVDVIGGFALNVRGQRRPVPMTTDGVWELGGRGIPLGPLPLWYAIYRHYKPAKAERIALRISEEERIRACLELGLEAPS